MDAPAVTGLQQICITEGDRVTVWQHRRAQGASAQSITTRLRLDLNIHSPWTWRSHAFLLLLMSLKISGLFKIHLKFIVDFFLILCRQVQIHGFTSMNFNKIPFSTLTCFCGFISVSDCLWEFLTVFTGKYFWGQTVMMAHSLCSNST